MLTKFQANFHTIDNPKSTIFHADVAKFAMYVNEKIQRQKVEKV